MKNRKFGMIFLSMYLFLLGCKKEEQPQEKEVQLSWLEYRLLVNDPNINAVGLMAIAIDTSGKQLAHEYTSWRNASLGDTLLLRIKTDPGKELLYSVRKLQMSVVHKSKVYSPYRASLGIIVDGDPYVPGWVYVRWYNSKPDTVKAKVEQINYIRLSADTSRFIEF